MRHPPLLQLRTLKRDAAVQRLLYPETFDRPQTRGECVDGDRPCPFVGCRYHLGLDVTRAGALCFTAEDPTSLPISCALDVADAGGVTLEQIGSILGVGRERARQIEAAALAKLSNGLAEEVRCG